MLLLGAGLLLLPLLGLAQPALAPLPAELPCRFGVIGLRAEVVAQTLQVRGVVPGGPAARAGLRPGDRLLAAPPYQLHTAEELGRLVRSRSPGDSLALLVERQGRASLVACAITDRRHLFSFMHSQHRVLPPLALPATEAGRAAVKAIAPHLQAVLAARGALPALDQFRAALAAEDTAYGADCRLGLVRRTLREPLGAPGEVAALGADLGQPNLDLLLSRAAAALDLVLPRNEADPGRGPDSLLSALDPFFAAQRFLDQALAALGPAQVVALRAAGPGLLQGVAGTPSPDLADSTEDADLRLVLGLAKEVRLVPLFAAARQLARLATPASLARLRRCARAASSTAPAPPGVDGPVLYARETPQGWLLVGGSGPNHYRGRLAVILDLGGDDTYELGQTPPVSLLIDYRGNDLYLGPVAAPMAGVALTVDLQGDDRYESQSLGQGAAFCGVGMLIDAQGRDQYQADHFAQGAALFGAGLLLDGQGEDHYAASSHSQGFGGPRGFGLLRDRQGHDRYLADGRVPSSYGEALLYEGWSQGVGCGVRGYAEGGIGLLLDEGGDDQYQAGNFGQGVGYFFGLGALIDRRGDDRYRGSRYAQGAAAHQAVGALIDLAGDDHYLGRAAAAQGSGWDAAVGLLVDQAGNDQYQAGELAQGAGAMNGFGLLFDQRGRDGYEAVSGQGATGSLEYWGGRQAPNLGVFWDGAGPDRYNMEGRGDGASLTGPYLWFFEDR